MKVRIDKLSQLMLPGVVLASCFNYSLPVGPLAITPQKVFALLFLGLLFITAIQHSKLSLTASTKRRLLTMIPLTLAYIGFLVLELLKGLRYGEVGFLIPCLTNSTFCLGLWASYAYPEQFWRGFHTRWFVYAALTVAGFIVLIQLGALTNVLSGSDRLYTGMRLRGLGVNSTINLWAQALAVLTVILILSARRMEPIRIATCGILFFLMILSFSRSILFSLLAFLLFHVLFSSEKAGFKRVATLAILVGFAFLAVSIADQTSISYFWAQRLIAVTEDGSLDVRLSAWGLTWDLLSQAPWLGVSQATLKLIPPQENSFLFLLSYYGLFGLLLYLTGLLRWVYCELKRRGTQSVPLFAFVFLLSFSNENIFNVPLLTLIYFSQFQQSIRNRID